MTVYEFNGDAIDDSIDSGYFNITTTGDVKITNNGKDVLELRITDLRAGISKADRGGIRAVVELDLGKILGVDPARSAVLATPIWRSLLPPVPPAS